MEENIHYNLNLILGSDCLLDCGTSAYTKYTQCRFLYSESLVVSESNIYLFYTLLKFTHFQHKLLTSDMTRKLYRFFIQRITVSVVVVGVIPS